jgi:hypothetical protein
VRTEFSDEAVPAGRTYDGDAVLPWAVAHGAVPIIPPHPVRTAPRPPDRHLDEERAGIECPFGELEHVRRVFGRFDELAHRHLVFVHLAAACILLR